MGTKLQRSVGAMRPGFRSVVQQVMTQNNTDKKTTADQQKTYQSLSPRPADIKAGRSSRQKIRLSHNDLRKPDRRSRQERSQERQSSQEIRNDKVSNDKSKPTSEQKLKQTLGRPGKDKREKSTDRNHQQLPNTHQPSKTSKQTEYTASESQYNSRGYKKQAREDEIEPQGYQRLQVPGKTIKVAHPRSKQASPRHSPVNPGNKHPTNGHQNRQHSQAVNKPNKAAPEEGSRERSKQYAERHREKSTDRQIQQLHIQRTQPTKSTVNKTNKATPKRHNDSCVTGPPEPSPEKKYQEIDSLGAGNNPKMGKQQHKVQPHLKDTGHYNSMSKNSKVADKIRRQVAADRTKMKNGKEEVKSQPRPSEDKTPVQKLSGMPTQSNAGSTAVETEKKDLNKYEKTENGKNKRARRKWASLAQLVAQTSKLAPVTTSKASKTSPNQDIPLVNEERTTVDQKLPNVPDKAKVTTSTKLKTKIIPRKGKLLKISTIKREPISYRRNATRQTKMNSVQPVSETAKVASLDTEENNQGGDKLPDRQQKTSYEANSSRVPVTKIKQKMAKTQQRAHERKQRSDNLAITDEESDMAHPLNRTMTLLKGYSEMISTDASGEINPNSNNQLDTPGPSDSKEVKPKRNNQQMKTEQGKDITPHTELKVDQKLIPKIDLTSDQQSDTATSHQPSDPSSSDPHPADLTPSDRDPADPSLSANHLTPSRRPSTATARQQQQRRRQRLLVKLEEEARRREGGQPVSPARRLTVTATPSPTPSVAGARSPRPLNMPRVRLDSETAQLKPS